MTLLLLLGVPGIGKGCLSQELVNKFKFRYFSTGKILRAAKEKYKDILSSGNLVTDDDVNKIALDELQRIQKEDPDVVLIMDGYPRTAGQAEFIKNHFPINRVFYLVPKSEEYVIQRLSNRVLCEKEDHSFNLIHNPPKVAGICDFDGSKLYKRTDDSEEVIRKRLNTYKECTQPLIDYYKKLGILEELDASEGIWDFIDRFKVYKN
ncbi:adenylate kinase [Mycoplasma haemofelis str. Langford 1]|uniref:Adenylate kinase n=2 Tax=Mycoplasma haemofelis TaxID=29501 RepID=F6FHB6_MYCHI|nr:nucleoside monophosphate kinase [Mycoplasma haemofelis]AEG73746.1 adenylate kinase [Mycoplasma haemofelis Ohio2]CBY93450.1 adenylate kinase [Mycoplasma haemofelis str. Langford 1]